MDNPKDNKESTTQENTDSKRPEKQKWSKNKKIVVIIGGVIGFFILFFIIIATFANIATNAPLQISNEFVTNVQQNKASDAYDLMSSDAQLVTSSKDFTAMVKRVSPILTNELENIDKEVKVETGSDPTAKITYETKGNDNYTYKITVNLIQKDDEWKVLNFESTKK